MDNNSIDFGKIYGISGECAGGPCEFTGNIVPNTPSLEQIASYNVQLRSTQDQSNPEIERKLQTLEEGYRQGILARYNGDTVQAAPSVDVPPQPAPGTGIGAGVGGGQMAEQNLTPITEYNQPFPVTGESIQYLNGFMRTQIGRRIELQMLVGSDTLVTKEGFLLGIGANYILINETGTNDLTSCDFYNIKFVRYFY
ncbi:MULTISPECIES: hypothetical protein [unclassified Ruminococcus]|uniref:hypothetical protein n=1 Tax=unclassified Ruminococcus TaxID=2608920 RepID=UPI00210DC4EC|nr:MULTISPECIES: hypothetical protein [unclassified Ruminococcus]MCQ4022127.1 hypothetical protein [Ruminococcus sp. zg-924]MCQ4114447.1 hypothetical protein [Ruminococcus sp. zg-921]